MPGLMKFRLGERLEILLPKQEKSQIGESLRAVLSLIATELSPDCTQENTFRVFICIDDVLLGRFGLLSALDSYCEFISANINHHPSDGERSQELPPPLIVTYRCSEFLETSFAFPPEFVLSAEDLTLEALIRRSQILAQFWTHWREVPASKGGAGRLIHRQCFSLDMLRECLVPGLRLDLGFDKWHHDHSAELASSLEFMLNSWEGKAEDDGCSLYLRDWQSREDGNSRAEDRFARIAEIPPYKLLFPSSLKALASAAQHIAGYIAAALEARNSGDKLGAMQQLRGECSFLLAHVPKRSGLLIADLPALRRNILLIDDQAAAIGRMVGEHPVFAEPHSSKFAHFFRLFPAPLCAPSSFTELRNGFWSLLQRSGEGFCGAKRPEAFDVIFLDLSLKEEPGSELGGFELLSHLRDHFPDLPILVFSSFEQYRYVMEAVRLGASWYCRKSEPRALLRSFYEITRIGAWEKRAARLRRTASGADDIGIPPKVVRFICEELARDLPAGSIDVKRLAGGIGGAITARMQICPDKVEGTSRVIPLVVKIDKPYRMIGEYQRFLRFIRPYAENRAGRIDRHFVRAGNEWAGIAYSFSGVYQGLGGRVRDVETITLERLLIKRLSLLSSESRAIEPLSTIEPLLDELFDETMAPLHAVSQSRNRNEWWDPIFGEAPSLRGTVELRLPALSIELEALLEPDLSRAMSTVRRIGRRVMLESFFVEDVDREVISVVGVSGTRTWRAKLEGSYAKSLAGSRALRPFSPITVVGRLARRRAESIRELSSDAVEGQLQRMGLDGTGWSGKGPRLHSPFQAPHVARLLRVLDLVEDNVGIVHGDLNLGNILVEITGIESGDLRPIFPQPWLIDFARTRRDSIAHDFVELETSIVSKLVKEELFPAMSGDEQADNLREFLATLDRTALDFPANARRNPRLQFIFEFVALVRRKAARAGVSRIEYESLLYFYYLIVMKVTKGSSGWTNLLCSVAGHFALKAIQEEIIRVSAAALWRIEIDGKFLLGLNHNRFAKGVSVLSPIGGAVSIADEFLACCRDVRWESVAAGRYRDLRFNISVYNLPRFDSWYRGGSEAVRLIKEQSALRELSEELIEEFGVVEAHDIASVAARFHQSLVVSEATTRGGVEGRITRRYIDVYCPELQSTDLAERFKARFRQADLARKGLYLVSYEEIKIGRTISGLQIASSAQALL